MFPERSALRCLFFCAVCFAAAALPGNGLKQPFRGAGRILISSRPSTDSIDSENLDRQDGHIVFGSVWTAPAFDFSEQFIEYVFERAGSIAVDRIE